MGNKKKTGKLYIISIEANLTIVTSCLVDVATLLVGQFKEWSIFSVAAIWSLVFRTASQLVNTLTQTGPWRFYSFVITSIVARHLLPRIMKRVYPITKKLFKWKQISKSEVNLKKIIFTDSRDVWGVNAVGEGEPSRDMSLQENQ